MFRLTQSVSDLFEQHQKFFATQAYQQLINLFLFGYLHHLSLLNGSHFF